MHVYVWEESVLVTCECVCVCVRERESERERGEREREGRRSEDNFQESILIFTVIGGRISCLWSVSG